MCAHSYDQTLQKIHVHISRDSSVIVITSKAKHTFYATSLFLFYVIPKCDRNKSFIHLLHKTCYHTEFQDLTLRAGSVSSHIQAAILILMVRIEELQS
jgi:hypothetical protein